VGELTGVGCGIQWLGSIEIDSLIVYLSYTADANAMLLCNSWQPTLLEISIDTVIVPMFDVNVN